MGFTKSFDQSFNPAFNQSANNYADAQRQKVAAAIAEQQRQAERDRQIADDAAQYGVSPIMGADGKLNAMATLGATQQAKGRFQLAQEAAARKARSADDLAAKATELGIDPAATAKPTNAPGWSVMAKEPAQIPAAPLAKRVADAASAAATKQAADTSRARAEASAPFESTYSPIGHYAKDGNYVGAAVRNTRTGEAGIMGADGKLAPIPEGAQPITPTAINKNIVDATTFKKFKTDLTDSERSLRQFERYATSVGGMNPGVQSLADRFTAGVKTLLGEGKLDPAELARKAAAGQLQGLLGGNRVSVVGGGVLTEQDAERIIQRLGGDVGAMQNKEVVMKALGELYQDRYAQYQDDYNFYNEAVDSYWGAKGFKKQDRTDFNGLFGGPASNGSVPAPVAEPKPAAAPRATTTGLSEAEANRLRELRAKLGAQP